MKGQLTTFIACIGLIVMVAFPKAGFYVGAIPITIGYLILGIFAVLELLLKAIERRRSAPPVFAYLWIMLFTFGVIQLAAFRIYGVKSFGVAISILVSTLVVPPISILATQWMLRFLGTSGLVKTLRVCLLIVFVYGFASFFAYNMKGVVIGVPFLTTTGDDVSQIFERHNMRGSVVKMFSTYNNGNILGINMLLWGPIAAVGLNRSLSSAVAYRLICLFTLSRTVWVGLLVFEVIGAITEKSTIRIQRALFATTLLAVIAVGTTLAIGKDPADFLLDKNLGGRVSDLQSDLKVISQQRIGWDSESVYAASWLAYGLIGVLGIVAIWFAPILAAKRSPIHQSAKSGMIVYMIIASVEGAFTLIPTQSVYWMVATLAMTDVAPTASESPPPTQQIQNLPTSINTDGFGT